MSIFLLITLQFLNVHAFRVELHLPDVKSRIEKFRKCVADEVMIGDIDVQYGTIMVANLDGLVHKLDGAWEPNAKTRRGRNFHEYAYHGMPFLTPPFVPKLLRQKEKKAPPKATTARPPIAPKSETPARQKELPRPGLAERFITLVDVTMTRYRRTGHITGPNNIFQRATAVVKHTKQALEAARVGIVHESLVHLMPETLQREWPFDVIKDGAATVVSSDSSSVAVVVNVI